MLTLICKKEMVLDRPDEAQKQQLLPCVWMKRKNSNNYPVFWRIVQHESTLCFITRDLGYLGPTMEFNFEKEVLGLKFDGRKVEVKVGYILKYMNCLQFSCAVYGCKMLPYTAPILTNSDPYIFWCRIKANDLLSKIFSPEKS